MVRVESRRTKALGAMLAVCVGSGVFFGGGAVHAQDSSMTSGVDLTTQYFFRGIVQETKGAILQPWVELTTPITPPTGDVGIDLTIGLWNSLHTGDTGTGGGTTDPRAWYESDFYLGLGAQAGKVAAAVTYTIYSSPNNSFESVQEFAISFTYDDSADWGTGFAGLNPSATLALETKRQADGGTGAGGTYLELAVEPALALFDDGENSIAVTVPAKLGLSLDDYYEDSTGDDDFYGYFQVGLHAAVPLESFLPPHFGNWQMSFGIDLLFLGDNTERYNGGDEFETISTLSLSTEF